MKKTRTFSRYIFLVLLVLESLTLIVVAGVLHAMLVRSFDREYHNEIISNMAEFRYFLKDRREHVKTRLDEICANNGIKVALMLEMDEKVSEIVTSLYSTSNGITYYIHRLSGDLLPNPSKNHLFLEETILHKKTEPEQKPNLITSSTDQAVTIFVRSIFRKEQFLGRAIGMYDLAADKSWSENLQSYKNYHLFHKVPNGLRNVNNNQFVPWPEKQKNIPIEHDTVTQVGNLLVMPVKGYPDLYWAADTLPLTAKKRHLLTNIVLLCIPLLCLALSASYMIIKRMTAPLNAIADDARRITQESPTQRLDEGKIRLTEFLDLAKALNRALSHIQLRNEQLLQLNQDLQDEIAERRQLSDALTKSEEQFRTLQNNIPIALFRTTFEGRVVYGNPACINVFGFKDLEEFQKINVKDYYEHKTDRQNVLSRLDRDGIVEDIKVRLRRKDGSLFWATMHIKKVTDIQQGTTYLDGTIQDISQQIKASKEKKLLEDQLRQAQRLETIGTLAGGIAHDFNNMLASITGFTELALDDAPPDTIQHENLGFVLEATQHATDLVSQILTFARQADTEKIPINVHEILEEALKLLRSTIPSTIEVIKRVKTTSAIMAAPSQLHQVIVNLCSNASHAMRTTGGTLLIELSDVELEVGSLLAGHVVKNSPHVKLSITDTGHGMTQDVIGRIFDPFFTTKGPGEGTGIGLSVVQGIVTEHGGFLSVVSTPEHGTTFEVYLPRIEKKGLPKIDTSSIVVGGNERILLVDDEKHIVLMAERTLEQLGYHVTTCSNGFEAFEAFKKTPDNFDLVITDLTMPGLTGDFLAKKITSINPEIPVILWTGYNNRLEKEDVVQYGINAIIYKPLLKARLANTIREVLATHSVP